MLIDPNQIAFKIAFHKSCYNYVRIKGIRGSIWGDKELNFISIAMPSMTETLGCRL